MVRDSLCFGLSNVLRPLSGDTLDLTILGAVWEKERARELRGNVFRVSQRSENNLTSGLEVSPSVYTTFYLGVFTNPDHQVCRILIIPRATS